jgi:hypothetical protein
MLKFCAGVLHMKMTIQGTRIKEALFRNINYISKIRIKISTIFEAV